MNHLKPFTILIILILLTGTIYPDEPITFNCALLYRQGRDEIKSVGLDESSIHCKPGDEIKVYLHPVENAYIYLFLIDTAEHLYLLFPRRISFFDLFYTHDTMYSFPGGNEWAVLDYPAGHTEGTEELILIASSVRLKKLEKLIVSYNNLFFREESNAIKLAETRSRVIEEIQRLKHEHSQFTRKAKADLIKVAVEIRSPEEKQKIPMAEIKADTFYTKTIRIRY